MEKFPNGVVVCLITVNSLPQRLKGNNSSNFMKENYEKITRNLPNNSDCFFM